MTRGQDLTRRQLLRGGAAVGAGAAAATLLSGAPARAQSGKKLTGPVNFLGWGGHKEDAQSKDFADRTGVKLNFSGFAENADALTKVKLEGGSRWDLVAIDALWVPKFNELKLLEPVDLKSWPIYKDLFDEFKDLPALAGREHDVGRPVVLVADVHLGTTRSTSRAIRRAGRSSGTRSTRSASRASASRWT